MQFKRDQIANLAILGWYSKSQRRDSNPRPADYKSAALPTELRWRPNAFGCRGFLPTSRKGQSVATTPSRARRIRHQTPPSSQDSTQPSARSPAFTGTPRSAIRFTHLHPSRSQFRSGSRKTSENHDPTSRSGSRKTSENRSQTTKIEQRTALIPAKLVSESRDSVLCGNRTSGLAVVPRLRSRDFVETEHPAQQSPATPFAGSL